MMTKGNINVSVENIFPLIKKFLYSYHEIFLRELISNATDATLKLKHLTSIGEAKVEYGNPKLEVKIDKDPSYELSRYMNSFRTPQSMQPKSEGLFMTLRDIINLHF